jgi:hypothetical protein
MLLCSVQTGLESADADLNERLGVSEGFDTMNVTLLSGY